LSEPEHTHASPTNSKRRRKHQENTHQTREKIKYATSPSIHFIETTSERGVPEFSSKRSFVSVFIEARLKAETPRHYNNSSSSKREMEQKKKRTFCDPFFGKSCVDYSTILLIFSFLFSFNKP